MLISQKHLSHSRICPILPPIPAVTEKHALEHLRPSRFAVSCLKFVGIVFVLAWLHGLAFAASTNLFPSYRIDVWKTEHGLPHNTIEAIVQTRDGYLWLATPVGLARFDGVTFTVFNRRNTPEMVSDECHALAEDTDGNLWIGTYRGLLRYRDGVFTRFTRGFCKTPLAASSR